jgi:hypothetical protein
MTLIRILGYLRPEAVACGDCPRKTLEPVISSLV